MGKVFQYFPEDLINLTNPFDSETRKIFIECLAIWWENDLTRKVHRISEGRERCSSYEVHEIDSPSQYHPSDDEERQKKGEKQFASAERWAWVRYEKGWKLCVPGHAVEFISVDLAVLHILLCERGYSLIAHIITDTFSLHESQSLKRIQHSYAMTCEEIHSQIVIAERRKRIKLSWIL